MRPFDCETRNSEQLQCRDASLSLGRRSSIFSMRKLGVHMYLELRLLCRVDVRPDDEGTDVPCCCAGPAGPHSNVLCRRRCLGPPVSQLWWRESVGNHGTENNHGYSTVPVMVPVKSLDGWVLLGCRTVIRHPCARVRPPVCPMCVSRLPHSPRCFR